MLRLLGFFYLGESRLRCFPTTFPALFFLRQSKVIQHKTRTGCEKKLNVDTNLKLIVMKAMKFTKKSDWIVLANVLLCGSGFFPLNSAYAQSVSETTPGLNAQPSEFKEGKSSGLKDSNLKPTKGTLTKNSQGVKGAKGAKLQPVARSAKGISSKKFQNVKPGTDEAASSTESLAGEEEREWAERDRKVNEANTLKGGVGLLHTQHAESGAPGQFRTGFTLNYFTGQFLCTTQYPCVNPSGSDSLTKGKTDSMGGSFSLGATLVGIGGGALEAYASLHALSVSSDVNRPALIQTLGDTNLGVKLGLPVVKTLHLGVLGEVEFVGGAGSLGTSWKSTSGRLGPLVTVDLRELATSVPLRLSVNGLYVLNNRGQLIKATEKNGPITRFERFALGIHRIDHVDLHAGVEALLLQERLRPFVEYSMAIPVNRQNYQCTTNNINSDKCLEKEPLAPSSLTIGGRFFPWKRGLSLTAAADIGIMGTKTFIEEMAPVLPWQAFVGAGWSYDTRDRPPQVKVVEKRVEVKPPAQSRIQGFVHEKDKQEGIIGALVHWENHPELTALATGNDGRFVTQPLEAGLYRFAIRAEGYKEGSCEATITEETQKGKEMVSEPVASHAALGGKSEESKRILSENNRRDAGRSMVLKPLLEIDCALEALPRVGTVLGRVVDAVNQNPVAGANLKLTLSNTGTSAGGVGQELTAVSDNRGEFRFDNVPVGAITILADAPEYLAWAQRSEVKARQDAFFDIQVHQKPKKSLVTLDAKEIKIKQQILFAVDSATILPASFGLLEEIADVLHRHLEIQGVEIQGHTDNTGSAEHNKLLSEQRAQAVREWLIAHGVSSDRLMARGYGQEKPLVPNVTRRNKAKNRRVQFLISKKS